MNAIRIAAIALIVAGALGLAYGSISFTKQTHEARLGPIQLSVNTLPQIDALQATNELFAAMPLVIFAKAVMAAFQGPAATAVQRVSVRRITSN